MWGATWRPACGDLEASPRSSKEPIQQFFKQGQKHPSQSCFSQNILQVPMLPPSIPTLSLMCQITPGIILDGNWLKLYHEGFPETVTQCSQPMLTECALSLVLEEVKEKIQSLPTELLILDIQNLELPNPETVTRGGCLLLLRMLIFQQKQDL